MTRQDPPVEQTTPSDPAPASDDDGGRDWRTSIVVPIAIVAIAGAVIVGIVVVGLQEQDEGMSTLAGTRVVTETLPVVVPFEAVAGHIVVDATLGSAATPTRLILDSGAPVILASDLLDRYGGDAAGSVASASIDGTVTTSDVVAVPRLDIGGARFTDVGAVDGFIAPDNPLACISDRGLIGANLMQQAVWQVDFADDSLTIAPSIEGLDHIENAIAIPFERASEASPSPIIELPAGEGSLRFLVDTGSDGWIVVNPDDLEGTGAAVTASAPMIRTIGAGASGTFETALAWTSVDLVLGEERMQDVPIATSTAIAAGHAIVGTALLSGYVVTIDWTDDTLYLDQISSDRSGPDPPMAAQLTWQGDGYAIGSIVDGATGTEALTLGDPVVAVDGQDVTAATFDDFCATDRSRAARPLELTLGDEARTTVIVAPVSDFYAPLSR